jgi:hypothetical protein
MPGIDNDVFTFYDGSQNGGGLQLVEGPVEFEGGGGVGGGGLFGGGSPSAVGLPLPEEPVGSIKAPLSRIPNPNVDAVINGRLFSGHALDRMQQ